MLAVGAILLPPLAGSIALAQARPETAPPDAAQPPDAAAPAAEPAADTAAQPGAAQPAGAAQPKAAAQPEAAAPAKEEPPAYIDEPLDEEQEAVKALKGKRFAVTQILRNGTFESQQQQTEFENYYDQYALARWKDLSRTHQLSDYRKDLANELKMGKTGAPHETLVDKAMSFCTDLVTGNYHPAVKVNAMLVIGDLNERDTTLPTEQPVPLPAALPLLLQAVNDPDQLDAVKVVALLGIIRHATLNAELGIGDQNLRDTQLVPAMLQLATTKVQPGRSAEGHAWMRMLAMEALAAAGVLGDETDPGKVPRALADIVAEKEASMLTRCAAARALGKLTYPAGLDLDPVALGVSLGQLAAEACAAELERAEEEALAVAATAGPQYTRYAEGYEYDSEEDEEEYGDDDDDDGDFQMFRPSRARTAVDTTLLEAPMRKFRRRLKNQLQAAWEGIIGNDEKMGHRWWRPPEGASRDGYAGISVLATTEQQQAFIDGLLKQLQAVMDLCDNMEALQTELADRIQFRSDLGLTPPDFAEALRTELASSIQLELDKLNQLLANPAAVAPAKEQPEEAATPGS